MIEYKEIYASKAALFPELQEKSNEELMVLLSDQLAEKGP